MTPQLQQAIRLLQMTTQELTAELLQAHEENPLLELADDSEERTSPDAATESEDEHSEDLEQLSFDNNDVAPNPDGYPTDNIEWDESATSMADFSVRGKAEDGWQPEIAARAESGSLRDSLLGQAQFLLDNESDLYIAGHIIGYIDDAGYVEVPLEEILRVLGEGYSLADVERVLLRLQSMEPVGVAARSPAECLALQLAARESTEPGYEVARAIVAEHLPMLGTRDFDGLQRLLGASRESLREAVELIQRLNPHPGYSVGVANVRYVTPDIVVNRKGDHWYATLNVNALPRLVINQNYQVMISDHPGDGDFSRLKEQLQNARWLLSSLEKRHETILSVAREIVERQQGFFESGPEKMKPMVLKDIAEPLGVHESTVSRATSGKYMLTPAGVFELKYFFSTQLQTSHGEAASSTAIQSIIRKLIEEEPPARPISDRKICDELNEQGFEVARRTVAKYRELMNIPASSRRKSL